MILLSTSESSRQYLVFDEYNLYMLKNFDNHIIVSWGSYRLLDAAADLDKYGYAKVSFFNKAGKIKQHFKFGYSVSGKLTFKGRWYLHLINQNPQIVPLTLYKDTIECR